MTQVYPAKEALIKTDKAFRQLHEQHQQCERRLDDIYHLPLLSEEDEIEIKRLKIHKLHLKDRMEIIRYRYSLAPVV